MIEFAELEEFQDLKLKNYSSGMHVRLAFSVAIQVDADILLIDEVLAVGDAAFQQKCFDVFNRMREEGRTIIFVTHDMGAVTRFCHRAMLLERGEMVSIGDPRDVADRYLEIAFGRAAGYQDDGAGSARMGDGAARVTDVWLGDDPAERRAVAPQSEPLTMKALVTFNTDVLDPAVSMTLFNEQRQPVVVATTAKDQRGDGRLPRGRAGPVRLLLPQHARARALPPDPDDHPPRRRLSMSSTATRAACRSWSPGADLERRHGRDPGGDRGHALRRAPRRARSSRPEDRGERAAGRLRAPGAADPRPARAERQLAALLASRLQHRAQRIQTEVLRLGARIRRGR